MNIIISVTLSYNTIVILTVDVTASWSPQIAGVCELVFSIRYAVMYKLRWMFFSASEVRIVSLNYMYLYFALTNNKLNMITCSK
jgi:hypothetical protein